jgi:hypothetical protein
MKSHGAMWSRDDMGTMSAAEVEAGCLIRDALAALAPEPGPHPAAVALGKLGGRVRSEAKAEASRENGKKGGRPRKSSKKETTTK